jgi:hypothetical protein
MAKQIGGLILIGISSVLIKLTYPKRWFREAREMVEDQAGDEESDFDWRRRIRGGAGCSDRGMGKYQPERSVGGSSRQVHWRGPVLPGIS